jgi:hypothetical protein
MPTQYGPMYPPGMSPQQNDAYISGSVRAPSIAETIPVNQEKLTRKFKSSRLIGEYEKPWIECKDPRMKYDRILFWVFGFTGIAVGAYICYAGWMSVADQRVWQIKLPII